MKSPRVIGTTVEMRAGYCCCHSARFFGRSTRATQCDRYGPLSRRARVAGSSSAKRRARAFAGSPAPGSIAITSRYAPPHRFSSRLCVRIDGCAPPPEGATPSVSATYCVPSSSVRAETTRWSSRSVCAVMAARGRSFAEGAAAGNGRLRASRPGSIRKNNRSACGPATRSTVWPVSASFAPRSGGAGKQVVDTWELLNLK